MTRPGRPRLAHRFPPGEIDRITRGQDVALLTQLEGSRLYVSGARGVLNYERARKRPPRLVETGEKRQLVIEDVQNPARANRLATLDLPGYCARIAVRGRFLYGIDPELGKLLLVDVSVPSSPKLIRTQDAPGHFGPVPVVEEPEGALFAVATGNEEYGVMRLEYSEGRTSLLGPKTPVPAKSGIHRYVIYKDRFYAPDYAHGLVIGRLSR